MSILTPPIKCQGIKTKLVPTILNHIDRSFEDRWIEPFVGSAIVALNVQPLRAILADTNPHIIRFYQAIKEGEIDGACTRAFLEKEGRLLSAKGKSHYYDIRGRFNGEGRPLDFLFLNRSCFNGLIRFNKQGEFNVPFGHKPDRFAPAYITKIVNQIDRFATATKLFDWTFVCQDYRDTLALAEAGDFVYCDPPYIGRHVDYFNSWNTESECALHHILTNRETQFMVSTWHSNQHRDNEYLRTLWKDSFVTTKEHFYHVGAFEKNRKPILEALVTNYVPHHVF